MMPACKGLVIGELVVMRCFGVVLLILDPFRLSRGSFGARYNPMCASMLRT